MWSVMIPCFNCGVHLRQTLESVLAIDLSPSEMEIEVIDDCSTLGDIESIVSAYGGRVRYSRHDRNRGISATFTSCVERARGEWVHILHADDMVLPGFYEAIGEAISSSPEAALVFSRAVAIDEEGHWMELMHHPPLDRPGVVAGAFDLLLSWNFIVAPTAVVKRSVYERVGGFAPFLSHTADWEMWMRVAQAGDIVYVNDPYVCYRVHGASDTSAATLSGRTMTEYETTVRIGLGAVSNERLRAAQRRARRDLAKAATGMGGELLARNLYGPALRYSLYAARYRLTLGSVLRVARLILPYGWVKIRSRLRARSRVRAGT